VSTGHRRGVFSLLAACALAVPLVAQTGIPPVDRAKLAKLAEPWPDAETLRARRLDAEARRLFADTGVFPFTLTADFKTVNKDRNPESKTDYPAVMSIEGEGGRPTILHVNLRPRGHFRLRATSCSFVPLRVEFDKDEIKGTIFDHQKTLKLTTHCRNDSEYEQYTLREYLVYRVLNLLTPRSFRARLARATYVQATGGRGAPVTDGGKVLVTRWAMFLEDDEDVARRAEGRIMDVPRALFKDVDQNTLSLVMVFQYMIGNTDFSIYALHNIRLIRTQDKSVYPVPYDFDMSGLVDARYALADRTLGITSVRDRLYRGPCRSLAEIGPVLEQFKARKDEVLALYDSQPELDPSYRRDAKSYLDQFYRTLDRPADVRRTFIEGQCSKKSLM